MEKQKNIEKQKPLISIVMLNWNGLHYLKRTIPAILNVDYPNLEFIIVDNGSDDGSIGFIKKFKRIKLTQNRKNLGYSKGKNKGMLEAEGEYILCLDNDVLVDDKKMIDKLLGSCDENTGFLMPILIDLNEKKTDRYGIFFAVYGYYAHKKKVSLASIMCSNNLLPIGAPLGGIFFIKKSVWNHLGYFDESQDFNLDDIDIGPRAYIFGYKNFLLTDTYAVHVGINKTQYAKCYASRFRTMFSGHARSMLKNYKFSNLIYRFPIFFFFQFFKAIRYSFKNTSPRVFGAFLWSVCFFIKNLPDTLKQKKIIQSKRVVKKDIFLKIKPPKFE
jgi:GT2 family glycosyltransferase